MDNKDGQWFGIGVYKIKYNVNIGTLIRSAHAFGASYVFTIGRRYKKQCSAKSLEGSIPVFNFESIEDWKKSIPLRTRIISIENKVDSAISLPFFQHPKQCVYVLGAEDHGLSKEILNISQCVEIPTKACINVATAGSIVMYDRVMKMDTSLKDVSEVLNKNR